MLNTCNIARNIVAFGNSDRVRKFEKKKMFEYQKRVRNLEWPRTKMRV